MNAAHLWLQIPALKHLEAHSKRQLQYSMPESAYVCKAEGQHPGKLRAVCNHPAAIRNTEGLTHEQLQPKPI